MPESGTTKGQGLVIPKIKRMNLGRSWFLGIGINEYQHWSQLNNAVRDVQDFAKLLIDSYDVEESHATIITDKAATEDGIVKELDRLVNEVAPEDKVLIYYSGHGHLNKNTGRGYWVPQDAEKNATAKFIRNSTIRDYLEDIGSLHTLLITDACFSGSLFMDGATKGEDRAMEELEQKPSRWALCSGRHDEEVHDGKPGENSPFALALLDALKENTKDFLNIGALVDRVIRDTKARYQQLPLGSPVLVNGHKWGEYIFRRLLDEDAFWNATLAKGALSDFSNYMLRFPQGKYIDLAERAVEAIDEREEWLKASKAHELRSYRNFLVKFPKGFYMPPAKILLTSLEEKTIATSGADFVDTAPPPPPKAIEVLENLDNVILPSELPSKRSKKETVEAEPEPTPLEIEEDDFDDIASDDMAPDEMLPEEVVIEEIAEEVDAGNVDEEYYAPIKNNDFCVILDAGHGGLDPTGKYVTAPAKMHDHGKGQFHDGSTFYEGVWNRTMVNAVAALLDQAGIHYIILSHDFEDTSLVLRTKMANKYNHNYQQCILLSLHANASPSTDTRGFQVYTVGSPAGTHLAQILIDKVEKVLGDQISLDKSSALRKANFYLLKGTVMPALLVEHLFYTNYEDAQLLMDPNVINQFAKAHLEMILQYQQELEEA